MPLSITIVFPSDAANQSGYLTVTGDMPALAGSAKQVAWATEIRAKLARDFAETAAKAAKLQVGAVLHTDTDYIADVEAKIAAALTADRSAEMFAAAMRKVFARSDARYWIDNRTASVAELFRANLA